MLLNKQQVLDELKRFLTDLMELFFIRVILV
jgi:hypothetical protein